MRIFRAPAGSSRYPPVLRNPYPSILAMQPFFAQVRLGGGKKRMSLCVTRYVFYLLIYHGIYREIDEESKPAQILPYMKKNDT